MTSHEWRFESCPFLPEIDRVYTTDDLARLGEDRGEAFYVTALSYAQSYWRTGFPAKALLQCNRAFSAKLASNASIVKSHPLPYRAVAWILMNRPEGCFLGNPRRHYQHLATRMVEPQRELRVWRAWACWYLAKEILDEKEFPGDHQQIVKEGVIEPTRLEISEKLSAQSQHGEVAEWEGAVVWSTDPTWNGRRARHGVRIRRLATAELRVVQHLATRIWPTVYSDIISPEQINFMLKSFYSVERMKEEMEGRGVCFALIEVDGQPGGYLSFEVIRGERCCFLHKLYLCPEHHGLGMGALALKWVEQSGARLGLGTVKLRVNKNNLRAIRAYRRAGFVFAGEETTAIGAGFVMDDYWMSKPL